MLAGVAVVLISLTIRSRQRQEPAAAAAAPGPGAAGSDPPRGAGVRVGPPPSLSGSPAPLAALHAQAGRLLEGGGLESRLRSLRGYPVVLNAWASWCPPCREELPLLASASVRFGRRVAFLGADVEDTPSAARQALGETEPDYPSYAASLDDLRALGPAPGTPFTILLDRRGGVVGRHIGAYRSQGELDAEVASLARGS